MAESTPETVPFSSHLDELRRRLIWVLLGLFLAFTLVFSLWADDIVRYIIEIAVVTKEVNGEQTVVPIPLTVISPLETFSTTMRVSLYAALVFGYPWVMLQASLFVAPGLYRHERRFFQLAIPSIFLLFTAGAAFGRYILLPISIPFLLDFNVDNFGVHQSYALSQFLGLVFTLTFGLGFVFQIPLLVAPLIRFGLLSPPVGLNVYVVNGMARDVPIGESYRGVLPFLAADTVRLALLFAFPGITLWALQFFR